MVNRRDFLRHGLISATGLSLLGWNGWAEAQTEIRRADFAKKVVIIGAGLAGLAAAYELSQAGHDVTVAGSGDEALGILRRDQGFEVLFTDIRMPGELDGWQLAERARDLIPGLKIIFATGLNDDAGWKKPEDRLLAKPYRRDDLLKALA